MLTPLKLFIKYKKLHDEDKLHKDLNVTWSATNPKPITGQDDSTTVDPNPSVITIGDVSRHFEKDYIYLKLQTTIGCKATLKVVFST